MIPLPFAPLDRAALYASSRNLTIQKEELGSGYDGTVLATNRGTALKVLNNQQLYRQELAICQHLKTKSVRRINGFQVPQLVDFDDSLSIIEMTIVSPPFVLDFASARDWRRRFTSMTTFWLHGNAKSERNLKTTGRKFEC